MINYPFFPQAEFIYYGAGKDPQLKYKDKLYDYYTITNEVYKVFQKQINSVTKQQNINYEKWALTNPQVFISIFNNIKNKGS